MKRCKDCKFYFMRTWLGKNWCDIFYTAQPCKNYTRKWWKFWRQK